MIHTIQHLKMLWAVAT